MNNQKESFTSKTWFIVVTLIVFFPVGLFFMWRHNKFNMPVRVLISVFFGIALLANLGGSDSEPVAKEEPVEEVEVEKEEEEPEGETDEEIQEREDKQAKAKEEEQVKQDKIDAEEKEKEEAEEAEQKKKDEKAKAKVEKEEQYRTDITNISNDLSRDLGDFGQLFTEAGNDPTLMFSDDWIMETAMVIAVMDENLNKALELEAPKKFSKVDKAFKEAVNHYKRIPEDVPNAIDNMDVELLDSVTDEIDKGNQKVNEATVLMEDVLN